MADFGKIYFLICFVLPCFVFGTTKQAGKRENSLLDLFSKKTDPSFPSPQSSWTEKQKGKRSSGGLGPPSLHSIQTDNQKLDKKLQSYFRKKAVSRKEIQNFLIKNSFYQSEVLKTGTAYVIQNPIETVLVFKGNSFFSEKELWKAIKIDENKTGSFFSGFVEKSIKSIYQNQGFLKVKVEKKSIKKKWKEWIYLNISEGPRIRIAELKVKGLLSQPSARYESFIRNNSSDLIKKGFYSKKDLEAGYENLINHLKSQGYLQSKIYSDRIFFKGDRAFITLHLEEGSLTIIRDIQIQKVRAVPVWEILSQIQSRIQSSLQVHVLREDLIRVEKFYKSKGYLNMKITNKDDVIQYTPGDRYASVVIQVEEGPQAFISKINISGLIRAKKNMVRKLLKFKEGDVLTPLKKEQSIKALGATGLWTNISISEVAKENGFEVLVLFKERKPRSFRGGLGFNSQRGITSRVYSEITHRNLFGEGRALIVRASGQASWTRRQNPFLEYELSGRYREVFVPGSGYYGDISLTRSRTIFSYSIKNINFVKKNQISFFINKNVTDNLKMRWNVWSFENRTEACTRFICPENPQQIASTNWNVVWDRRDNIFDPSAGYLNSLITEWSSPLLGSNREISFVKADLQNQLYWTFIPNYTLGLTLKGGMIHATQDSRHIPVSRAFILGGQSSVRGYDGNIEGERIPHEDFAPIETANEALRLKKDDFMENVLTSLYGLINFNLRFPLLENLKGVLFYDLGSVFLKGQSREVLDYGHSAGIGFRYQTFLIPIGLDIAYKLPPSRGSAYRFHFSIGW